MRARDGSGTRVGAAAWVFLSLAGVSAALTVVFLGMRSVMEIGGVCAEGGPYIPRQPCPAGVPGLLIGGIWVGLILAFVYVGVSIRNGVPSLALLLWPALFLSLGWNFLEYGLDPPGEGGVAWGWLVCAVVFFLMGGVPLVGAIAALRRGTLVAPVLPRTGLTPPVRALRSMLRTVRSARSAPVAAPGAGRIATAEEPLGGEGRGSEAPTTSGERAPETPGDVVSALERLAWLHRSGSIDDEEYEAAKERILRPEGGGS